MSSEDGDEKYPDGKPWEQSNDWDESCPYFNPVITSGEGEEEEFDAMMGELTMEELKAAFRLFFLPR